MESRHEIFQGCKVKSGFIRVDHYELETFAGYMGVECMILVLFNPLICVRLCIGAERKRKVGIM